MYLIIFTRNVVYAVLVIHIEPIKKLLFRITDSFNNVSLSVLQSDFEDLRAYTYKESEVLVLCFSVCDRDSFSSVCNSWVPEIKRHTKRRRPVILVGTQIDMRTGADGEVALEEGEAMAKAIGADCYIECSAKSKDGLKDVFEHVVFSALKFRKKKVNIITRFFTR